MLRPFWQELKLILILFRTLKLLVSLPSSIRGMGGSSGFQVNVQNLMGNSHEQFMQDIDDIIDIANTDPSAL